MKKKILTVIAMALCVALTMGLFVACSGGNKKKDGQLTVTFYDTDRDGRVISTVYVDPDSTVSRPANPTKSGQTFVDWYATPSGSQVFDFSQEIVEDTSVFAFFSTYQNDTREFNIVGSGKATVLASSSWGKVINDTHKMKKSSSTTSNEYTFTTDLFVGDQFQFATNSDWEFQRGAGYVRNMTKDGVEYFAPLDSPYSNSAKKSNITTAKAGNYTFTLKTHPVEDWFDTADDYYTEETKNKFNYNNLDSITFTYNGETTEVAVEDYNYYIKGSDVSIKNGTAWGDQFRDKLHLMSRNEDKSVYTLSIFLKEKEEFLFGSTNTIENVPTIASKYIRSDALDEASKAFLDASASHNMVAKKTGIYSFTYTVATEKLSVTFEEATQPTYVVGVKGSNIAEAEKDWAYVNLTVDSTNPEIYTATITLTAAGEFMIVADPETLAEYTNNINITGGSQSAALPEGVTADAGRNFKAPAGTYKLTVNMYNASVVIEAVPQA